MPKIKSRVNTSSSQNGHLIFDTERKETTRCPSGPGALVLSACTGRRLKAWTLIAFTNKGGFRVGAGGDSSGGSAKMASKPPDEQHDIVSLPSQRDTTGIYTWKVQTVNQGRRHVVKQVWLLTPGRCGFFLKVRRKSDLEQISSKTNTEQLVASFQMCKTEQHKG